MAPRRPVWLLEVKDRGGPRRYASRAVTVGGKVYQPGLAHFTLDVNEALSEHGVEVTDEQVLGWRPRAGEAASLSLYDEGTGEVVDLLDGIVEGPEWADPAKPFTVSFTVAAEVRTSRLYPPRSERVGPDTFEGPADQEAVTRGFDASIAGSVYPTIIGYPGAGDDAATAVPVAPALLVTALDYNVPNFLLSRGRIDATNVVVYDLSRPKQEVVGTTTAGDPVLQDISPPVLVQDVLAVQEGVDDLGQVYSYASLPVPFFWWEELMPYAGNRYAVGYTSKASRGGGMLGPNNEVLRGLGDVLLWMLTTGGVKVDTTRQLGHLADLNRSKVDAVINVPDADLPRLVDSQLLPVFSLLRVQTVDGVYYRRRVTDPQARHAVAHLSAERREITRTAAVRSLFRQPETSFGIEYGYNVVERAYLRSARAVPKVEFDGDLAVESLRRTVAVHGENPGPTIQTPWVWSDTTAKRCVADLALLRGRQWLSTSYELARLGGLTFGDVVTITDPEAGLDAQPAVITSMQLGGVFPVATVSWPEG